MTIGTRILPLHSLFTPNGVLTAAADAVVVDVDRILLFSTEEDVKVDVLRNDLLLACLLVRQNNTKATRRLIAF